MKSRTLNWTLPAVITLAVVGLSGIPATARSKTKEAYKLYKAGVQAEAKDDYTTAYADFYQAYQIDPSNLEFKTSYFRLRLEAAALAVKAGEKLRDQGDMQGALTEFLRALQIDPAYELAQQDINAVHDQMDHPKPSGESSLGNGAEAPTGMSSPVDLRPTTTEPITSLHMVADAKEAYQTVGKIAGINVLFDPDYTSKRVTVDLQNVSLVDALRIIGLDSNTFWKPITPNTIFVAQNTRAKRTELEEQAVQTFYLSNAAQQNDLNDVQTALRQLLTGAKLYAVPSQNAIVMRATPDELLLARQMIDDLDKARPEVIVDVAVLEVSKNAEHNIGIALPQSFGLQLQNNSTTTSTTSSSSTGTSTGTSTGSSTSSGLTLNQLGSLNATDFAVTVGAATANLIYTSGDTKVLQNPRVRATDGQKADLKIGERIPVATGSYQTGASTAVVSSLVNTQFQYLDVGVEIEVTPTVHYDRDVTLKLKIVVSQQANSVNISGVTEPIISQRQVEQTIRLKDGEPEILSGILTQQVTNTITGTPGLGELPLLKYLFSSNDHATSKDEIIFILTPHVVRGTVLSRENLQEIDTGAGQNVEVRRIATIPIKLPASAVSPSLMPGTTQPTTGPQNAAPAAQTPGTGNISIPSTTPVQTGAQVLQPPGQAAAAPPTGPIVPPDPVANPAPNAVPIKLQIATPSVMPKVGATFQVPVILTGGKDVYSVPLQIVYDPAKLTFINADTGNFLSKDGQIVAMAHRDDGGNLVLSLSRPPGAVGVSGDGPLCLLTFTAKATGDSIVSVSKATARNSQQQALPVTTAGAILHVTQ